MYGTETLLLRIRRTYAFENDVKMYGTETPLGYLFLYFEFENDVKMYGTETCARSLSSGMGLRMM